MKLALTPHSDTRRSAIGAIEVDVSRSGAGDLALHYRASGDMRELAAPPPGPIARADELWRHTCFEAFLQPEGVAAYCEFNFAPSRQWAAYRFDGYRNGMRPLEGLPAPDVAVSRDAGAFRLEARLKLDRVDKLSGAPWRLALTAIVETADGEKSYWSLAHPQGKPDFHRAENFALILPAETT